MAQRPVCLSVGGSDSCGGAGIQADLRVFEAFNTQGCSAITALTAQNPQRITHIEGTSIRQFEAEVRALAAYYPILSIKTGMLYDEQHLRSLVALKPALLPRAFLVVDPVLIASSGKVLFQSQSIRENYAALITICDIWTPNLQEAAYFLESPIDDPVEAASALLLRYRKPVLLKGGHGEGDVLRDVFCHTDGSVQIFEHPKQDKSKAQLHGTGCRLASAIAAYATTQPDLETAVRQAHAWLQHDLSL